MEKQEQKKYGYVRVSSKDQNESRQIKSMQELGIQKERIFIDNSFNRQTRKKL